MTTELTTEQLAQELERRQQAEQEEQQRQAETLRAAQQAWSADLLLVYKNKELQLEEEGTASMAAAEKALGEGDLTGAYFNYTGWHSSRAARYQMRTAAESAVQRVPDYNEGIISPLRWVAPDFPTWLNEQCSKLADRDGHKRYEELLGRDIPVTYPEAAAWLEANRGN